MTTIWLICYLCKGMPMPLEGWFVTLIICILMDLF